MIQPETDRPQAKATSLGKILVGADGCPAGWICVILDSAIGRIASAIHACANDVLHQKAEVIAIDIPIGLTDKGPRECDREARRRLGALRRSSVFPAPLRPALAAESRLQASEITTQADGRRVSAQAFGIFRKVREVDDALRADPDLGSRVFEVHPELSFWAWNGERAMRERKKSPAGKAERRRLIEAHFGLRIIEEVRTRQAHRRKAPAAQCASATQMGYEAFPLPPPAAIKSPHCECGGGQKPNATPPCSP